MDALMTGLGNLLDPQVLIALLIGSVGGLIIGAVPGIGPAIAIAILLPATVFLPDLVSLVLLLMSGCPPSAGRALVHLFSWIARRGA